MAKAKLFPWKLERYGVPKYGEAVAFVVMAPDNRQARILASRQALTEGEAEWLDGQRSSCAIVLSDMLDGGVVLLRSVNH